MAIETSPILMAKFMKKIHFFRPKDVPSRKEVSFFLLRMARLQFMRSSAGSAPTSLNWNNTTQGGEKEPGYGQLFLVREVPQKLFSLHHLQNHQFYQHHHCHHHYRTSLVSLFSFSHIEFPFVFCFGMTKLDTVLMDWLRILWFAK